MSELNGFTRFGLMGLAITATTLVVYGTIKMPSKPDTVSIDGRSLTAEEQNELYKRMVLASPEFKAIMVGCGIFIICAIWIAYIVYRRDRYPIQSDVSTIQVISSLSPMAEPQPLPLSLPIQPQVRPVELYQYRGAHIDKWRLPGRSS